MLPNSRDTKYIQRVLTPEQKRVNHFYVENIAISGSSFQEGGEQTLENYVVFRPASLAHFARANQISSIVL